MFAIMTINSEWVSILKTSHPPAFKESMNTVPVSWFVDGQIKLMKAAWIKTWEVFFRMQFVKTIDRAFENGAKIVIMGFDDYTHVPECKGMTQRKRNKTAQDFAYDSSKGLPEDPPEDWNAAMRNRIFKVAVIQFIVKNIKLHYKNFDKTVIVDWVGVPVVLDRPLSEDGRTLPDCVLDAESKRGECDIKAFAWTGWGPTMIESTDGDIGHVEGFLVDEQSWAIRYMIVDTSNWWAGKRVLVAPAWIEQVDWEQSKVHVTITRAQVEASPEYDPDRPVERAYETQLHGHYGQPRYWSE